MRDEMRSGTDTGKRIESFVKSGALVPDALVNHLVLNALAAADRDTRGLILDGFPRTLSQAEFLERNYQGHLVAVNIILDRDVTIQKLLGRRICTTCGGSFNTAHIVRDEYDMPAILPSSETCKRVPCEPKLVCRDDDTPQIIATRLNDFEKNVDPLLKFYRQRNLLLDFVVKKGIKDSDQLGTALDSFVQR
jgi:adenylate kinase